MAEKELIVTLTSDLFIDKHLLKIYKTKDCYLLSELNKQKRYYENGVQVIHDDITSYIFISHHEYDYQQRLKQIKATDYADLIKNPSLTYLYDCHPNKIEIININNHWIYKKYVQYDDEWALQFEGPCTPL